MLEVLLESRGAKSPRPFVEAAFSAGVHVVLVIAVVLMAGPRLTRELALHLGDPERNSEFLFPKIRGAPTPEEHLTYLATGVGLSDVGTAADGTQSRQDRAESARLQVADAAPPAERPPETRSEPRAADNAYELLDVDSAAVRDPASAAPEYPHGLMMKGIEGFAAMRFVVDSTGTIDMGTVELLQATHADFARAVREAMPRMRFHPAKVGTTAVRQLAEQLFRFELRRVASATESSKKKP